MIFNWYMHINTIKISKIIRNHSIMHVVPSGIKFTVSRRRGLEGYVLIIYV